MLIAGRYRARPVEQERGLGLKRFMAWTPPAGFTFKGHWASVDGNGGFFIAEADTAAAVFEATGAFSDLLDFEIVPVVEMAESVGISSKVMAWVDSVS